MKYLYLTAACLLINIAQAQTGKHEFSVYAGGGAANLVYGLSKDGSSSGGLGVNGGAAYTFNFNKSIGISAGVEFSTYSGKASYKTVEDTYIPKDDEFDFSYTLTGFEEKQSLYLFSIPVKVQYSAPFSDKLKFFAAGGLKFAFPVSVNASLTPGTLTSSGYYAHEDIRYQNLPQHGFYTNHSVPASDKKPELGFAAILSFDAGLGFGLGEKIDLYAGLYFDYGLNDLKKSKDNHLVEYQQSLDYNSVFTTALTDKINLMSFGLKLQLRIKTF